MTCSLAKYLGLQARGVRVVLPGIRASDLVVGTVLDLGGVVIVSSTPRDAVESVVGLSCISRGSN